MCAKKDYERTLYELKRMRIEAKTCKEEEKSYYATRIHELEIELDEIEAFLKN